MVDLPDNTTEDDWIQFSGSIDIETDTELTLIPTNNKTVSITFLRADILRQTGGIFIRKGCKIVRQIGIGSGGAATAVIVTDAEVIKAKENV